MDKENNKSFKKWLEILQQESWQLELLISGFAIFLLAGAYDQLHGLEYQLNLLVTGNTYFNTLFLPFQIVMGAWYVLIINLILHVLLRGLWISTIGIRYVSGEIDFEFLKFGPKFDRFLKKRIISFDVYIQQLESLCSIVFGFTFLIIFVLISLGIFVIGIVLFAMTLNTVNTRYSDGWMGLLIPIFVFYLIGGIIYFIDFMTLGMIKRSKSLSGLYYPIYRFYSLVTLSFVYRPLYYNLIDNRYGKKVVLFLIPYLVIFVLVSSMRFENHSYLPNQRASQMLRTDRYDDTWDSSRLLSSASIPSKFIANGYLELYLPYNGNTDDQVLAVLCPEIEPAEKGVFFFGFNNQARNTMNAEKALECHSQRYKIYVNDSLLEAVNYRFYDHPERKNNGLATILDVSYLGRGEHQLKIEVLFPRRRNGKDTLMFSQTDLIPFWNE